MTGFIHFSYQTKSRLPRDKARLKSFIVSIFKKEGTDLSHLRYIFCTDEFLQDINKRHLNHDDLTDVITFNYAGKGMPVQSESYISLDRVAENAKSFGSSVEKELLRVMFHSALHLCGYGDKSAKQKEHMTKLEDLYLGRYFL